MNYFTLKCNSYLDTFIYYYVVILPPESWYRYIEFDKDDYILAEFYSKYHILRKKLSLKSIKSMIDNKRISVCIFRIRKNKVEEYLNDIDFGEEKGNLIEWIEKEIERIENK